MNDATRRKIAIVTGASSGLGMEIARGLARRGYDLALVARRPEPLAALSQEIAATPAGQNRPAPLVVPLDLTALGAVDALLAALPQERFEIVALINNAGFGLMGRADQLPRDGQLDILDLNVRVLTDLTLAVMPRLTRPGGRILNVASLAAFSPGPGMAVYFASKAYVLSFSEALTQELQGSGVTVTALCPGPVATPFWNRAGAPPGLMRKMGAASATDVAEAGLLAMEAGRRRVTPGALNWTISKLAPLTPRSWLLPMMARFQAGRKSG